MTAWDYCGNVVDIGVVLASRKSRRHSKTHMQFKTLKYMCSCCGNFCKAYSVNAMQNLSLETPDIGYMQTLKSPIASFCFGKFMTVLSWCMGEIHKPDFSLSVDVISGLERMMRADVSKSQSKEEIFDTITFGSHVVISHVLSPRGRECLMMDLTKINKEIGGRRKCLTIALKGKMKGGSRERSHVSLRQSNVQMFGRRLVAEIIYCWA